MAAVDQGFRRQCRSAGAIRASCSARSPSSRCISAALALFGSQGAALATAALTFLNQMVFVQSRIAMLDIYALTFDLFGIAAFIHGYRKQRPERRLRACRSCLRPCRRVQMERLLSARRRHCHRRRDPPAAGMAHAVCRSERRRLVPARSLAGFPLPIISRCASSLVPALAYFIACIPVTGFSHPGFIEAQRRIFAENSAPHPPHLYMSSWPSWPLLMRPIWYQFDKIADERFQAIVFLGNPLILWPALVALGDLRARFHRRAAHAGVPDSRLLSRTVACLGDAAAHASASSITICRRQRWRRWRWSMC